MAIITVEQLKSFTRNYNDNPLDDLYINTTQNIIETYLGYKLDAQEYTTKMSGDDSNWLNLNHYRINSVISLSINGVVKDLSNIIIDSPFIYTDDYVFSKGTYNIDIAYNAGFSTMPDKIVWTALRIASLLKKEEDFQVGLKSKSFEDGSRDFYELNFDKYLSSIDSYRI